MSHVASCALWCFLDEDAAVQTVNVALEAQGYAPFVEVGRYAGGTKAMQNQVWLAAHNYMNIPRLLEAVWGAPWEYPEMVCFIVCDEEDDQPFVYRHPLAVPPTEHKDWGGVWD